MSDFEEMYNAKFRDQHYNGVCGCVLEHLYIKVCTSKVSDLEIYLRLY